MNILITGGTGFIGQSLCPALLSEGHTISVYSRYPNKVASIFGNRIEQVGSLRNLTEDDHFDAIVNFAGAPIFAGRWSEERKQVLLNSRLNTTRLLIDFIAKAKTKPAVLLSGSAIGFYGDQGDTLLDESSPGLDDFGHQLCAAWEHEAVAAKEYGVRVCLLRTGLVIGKHGGFLELMIQPFKFGLGGRLGSGNQWMPWIHIDDYVAMCQTLLNNNALEGVFNLTAPNPATNRDFTQALAAQLKRPALLPMPGWALKFMLGERAGLLLGSQRVMPKRLQDAGFQFKYPMLDAALADVL
ncbi:hypothetical protein SAMN05421690_1003119 [Nitrosomonas sp. Nm51]|uniref:TIGR01777 family oxidoreductase n=1 Tax=Nitrosomonas sp. Nm51 TaxID=133720 RepID=UPI0008B161DA|nr:TIGR01777 family oxidoreductase [Nitrosomonas sp. Nm51]SEQ91469.1 hypothetical protein SAMN05421690_1003119 [Nitrosomonas sp. Nm51]